MLWAYPVTITTKRSTVRAELVIDSRINAERSTKDAALAEVCRRLCNRIVLSMAHQRDIFALPANASIAKDYVVIPAPLAMKAAVYAEVRRRGMTKASLGRAMGSSETIARRVLDPRHRSTIQTMERALRGLGLKAVVSITSNPQETTP